MRIDMHTNGWSREFRNKPLHVWSVDFQQGSGHLNVERTGFLTIVV